jgi:hypothetical protein
VREVKRKPQPEPVHAGFRVTGFSNAAECALAAVKTSGLNGVDENSFHIVAKEIGDSPTEQLDDGFMVASVDSLTRLCHIGGFAICLDHRDGKLRCVRSDS